MFLLVATALVSTAAQTPLSAPAGASAQARATIRISSGGQLHFGDESSAQGLSPRDTIVRSADGDNQPAKLIEFQ
jgi:hypothetical protein